MRLKGFKAKHGLLLGLCLFFSLLSFPFIFFSFLFFSFFLFCFGIFALFYFAVFFPLSCRWYTILED